MSEHAHIFGSGLFWLGLLVLVVVAGGGLILRLHRDHQALLACLHGASGAPLPLLPATRAVWHEAQRRNQIWQREYTHLTALLAANRALLEALPDPLVLLDPSRCVRLANAAARHRFSPRMQDRDLAAFLRYPALLHAVDVALRKGQPHQMELHLPVPVEQIFLVAIRPLPPDAARATITALPADPGVPSVVSGLEEAEAHGNPFAAILSFHDITTIKRSEQMRGDFIANASHELRTPLSTLIGFIETLRGPARDDEDARERFLAIMHDQATRMARLVKDLLSLSRIELEEHQPPTEPVDISACVHRIAATFELEARSRDVALVLEIAPDLPSVLADEDQLVQVLMNLLGNALKFTRPHTTVTIRVWSGVGEDGTGQEGWLHLAVRDQGEGIARHHLPRLTERFYRVDTARSRSLGGTGLGLAIVKHIVNRHRGRLLIESDTGKGSTFTVSLPVSLAAP